ncbi:MAG: peptide deformylase [Chloroflexi bacterium]|nr:peptide deformylase [Chloroflexota bacterium]
MPVREIVTLPNDVLRRKARVVTDFGPELQSLIDDMVETMRAAPGVGLAAPQVDVSQRVIVVEFGDEDDEEVPRKLHVVVNPRIKRPSRDQELGQEGCLSIPGLIGDVQRSMSATVLGQNRRGHKVKIKAEGWLARIFQHEVDHINGILFIDKAERIYTLEELEEDTDAKTTV